MGRIAGIDFGEARLGLSISDERQIIASALPCLKGDQKMEKTAQETLRALTSLGPIDAIVLGLPLMLNGSEGIMSKKVREFAERLKVYFQGPILFWDERLTTAEVERILKEANVNRKKRSQLVDSLSAVLILQNYLDGRENQRIAQKQ